MQLQKEVDWADEISKPLRSTSEVAARVAMVGRSASFIAEG
jgi:hypothetical protein